MPGAGNSTSRMVVACLNRARGDFGILSVKNLIRNSYSRLKNPAAVVVLPRRWNWATRLRLFLAPCVSSLILVLVAVKFQATIRRYFPADEAIPDLLLLSSAAFVMCGIRSMKSRMNRPIRAATSGMAEEGFIRTEKST